MSLAVPTVCKAYGVEDKSPVLGRFRWSEPLPAEAVEGTAIERKKPPLNWDSLLEQPQ